jgi:ubiquinone/menaquinone biosynthesis C-methylase UbiE
MTLVFDGGIEQEIQTRIRLYDYSTGQQSFFEWQAGMLGSVKNKRVLEIGCGDGEFWQYLLPCWQNCDITLTDINKKMLDVAKNKIGSYIPNDNRIQFDQVDFNDLTPLLGHRYDIIIANHNLFYAENIYRLLGVIFGMLNPRGVLICSTVGTDHLHELIDLLRKRNANLPWLAETWAKRFGLENAYDTLSTIFPRVDQFEYDNFLHLPGPDPIKAYLMKTMKGQLSEWIEQHWEGISAEIQQVVDEKGHFRLTPHSGFCAARKP